MSKKVHFNVLSFINEFNLLHKYLLEFYWICCKFYGIIIVYNCAKFYLYPVINKKVTDNHSSN